MRRLRLLFCLFRWDVLREMRRKETLPNMLLFAVLVLFLGRLGVAPDPGISAAVGPVLFWISVLFAGTVGLSQTFAAEREGNALAGVVTAPIDLGIYYLAKVAAAWLYVMLLEVIVFWIYSVLFGFSRGGQIPNVLGVMGVFTLGYMGAGVVLAAMTTALRGGGEVLLRILLIPLMIPFIWIVLRVSGTLFDTEIAAGALGGPLKLSHFYLVGAAFDSIYLTAGYLLFPKVLEE
jgi:heme exporter protein B